MKFTENGICLGGQRARVTTRLSEGDVLEVLLETKNSSSAHLLSFERMPDILYEDADVSAANKVRLPKDYKIEYYSANDGVIPANRLGNDSGKQLQQYQRLGSRQPSESTHRLDRSSICRRQTIRTVSCKFQRDGQCRI